MQASASPQVVRSRSVVDEAVRTFPTATALLDFRPIIGDRSLDVALKDRAFANVFDSGICRVHAAPAAEARARRKRLDDSMYLLEPDMKCRTARCIRDL